MPKRPSEIIESSLADFSEHVREFMSKRDITLDIAILLLETLTLKYKTYLEDYRVIYMELDQEVENENPPRSDSESV